MSALTNRIFGKFAAPIALGIGAAATAFIPAAGIAQTMKAQPAAANTNVQATPVTFQTSDARNISVRGVQAGAAEASRDKIAIIVWGGSRELQQQAYNAALDLRDQGVPLAFIVGPSQMPNNNAVIIEIYGRGVSATQMMVGRERISELRSGLRMESEAAYARMFPRELAALTVK